MRVVFMGTPDFAVPCLQVLLKANVDVVGVVSQPDRRKGRGRKLQSTPTATVARQAEIPLFQWPKLNQDSYDELKRLNADLFVVVAYGKILPKRYLDLPRLGCWNIHASILPSLRGAAPIQWALINGCTETGVSLMQLDEGMDTGPVAIINRLRIGASDDASTLHDRLSQLGAATLEEGLSRVVDGSLSFFAQEHERASHARPLTKADGELDWSLDARKIVQRFKGMTPWPGCRANILGEQVKVLKMSFSDKKGTVGELLTVDEQGMTVACGHDSILVSRLQRPNRGPVSALEYVRAVGLTPGDSLL